MVVINPLILAGKRNAALANQAQSGEIFQGRAAYDDQGNVVEGSFLMLPSYTEATMMVKTLRQNLFSYRYFVSVPIDAPAFYILRPGPYTLEGHQFDGDLLAQYGLSWGEFSRLTISGHVLLNSGKCLSFYGMYNAEVDAYNMRGFTYMMNVYAERALPILQGEQDKAAISLAQLYLLYCDNDHIPLADVRDLDWSQFGSLNFNYMLYKD